MNKKRNWTKKQKKRIALEYYNRVFGKSIQSFDDIEDRDRFILSKIPLQQCVQYVCADDKSHNMSYTQISIRYGFTENQVERYVRTYRSARFVDED